MIRVLEILNKAKEQGIQVYAENGKLYIKLPNGKPNDAAFIEELKENKESILNFLNQKNNIIKDSLNTKSIQKIDRSGRSGFPLSNAQERLWFVDKMSGSQNYHRLTLLKLYL